MRSEDILLAAVDQFDSDKQEWGALIASMWLKQRVCRQIGVRRAFSFCARFLGDTIRLPSTEQLIPRTRRSLIDAASASGDCFSVVANGGIRFTVPPTRIVGTNDHAPFSGVSRTYYISCLRNCMIRGRSSVVMHDGEILVDAEGEEYKQFQDNPEHDPWILHADGDTFWTMEPETHTSIPVIDEAFMLTGSQSHEFGHWMTELFPKIGIAMRAGLDSSIPVLIDQSTPKTCKQALDMFLPKRKETFVIPHLAPCFIKKLWVASNPVFMGFFPTCSDLSVWQAMATYAPEYSTALRVLQRDVPIGAANSELPSKVFLARKPTRTKKKLENHSTIESLAQRRGFTIIYPEDHSFAEQYLLVNGSSHILGPEGSNMLLPFFAPTGSKVCCLNSPHTFPLADVNFTLTELGIDYTVFTGEFSEYDPEWLFWCGYRIKPNLLGDFLDKWVRQ